MKNASRAASPLGEGWIGSKARATQHGTRACWRKAAPIVFDDRVELVVAECAGEANVVAVIRFAADVRQGKFCVAGNDTGIRGGIRADHDFAAVFRAIPVAVMRRSGGNEPVDSSVHAGGTNCAGQCSPFEVTGA